MVVQEHLTLPVSEEAMDETIVAQVIGPVGRWQVEKSCLLGLCSVTFAWHFMQYPPITQEKEFWCKVPKDPGGTAILDKGQCWIITEKAGQLEESRCTEWDFERDGRVSLQEEFGLVCQHEDLLSLRQIVFFLGMTLGCLTTGKVAQ